MVLSFINFLRSWYKKYYSKSQNFKGPKVRVSLNPRKSRVRSKPKSRNYKLSVKLIPISLWNRSIYKLLKSTGKIHRWRKLKDKIFEKEGHKCWICGSEGKLEAHEFWEYDDKNHIQRLKGIHHICIKCHRVIHFGFSCYTSDSRNLLQKQGLTCNDLITHFCKVNNCTPKDFFEHLREANDLHAERSRHQWKQDFGDYEYLIEDLKFLLE